MVEICPWWNSIITPPPFYKSGQYYPYVFLKICTVPWHLSFEYYKLFNFVFDFDVSTIFCKRLKWLIYAHWTNAHKNYIVTTIIFLVYTWKHTFSFRMWNFVVSIRFMKIPEPLNLKSDSACSKFCIYLK